MAKPLEGIKILEWAIWLAGPGAGMMLSDLGAEVVKIEQPVIGDPTRGITSAEGTGRERRTGGDSFSYEIVNRNKKSIIVDVTKRKGQEIIYRLIPKFDVFLQNFRQDVRENNKLDYNTLSQYNTNLIYANISGFGPDGPDNWRRGNDGIGQARSGFMSNMQALLGEPAPIGGGIADHTTSIFAVIGILTALMARERQGVGQEIDISVLGSMISLQQIRLMNTFHYKRETIRQDRKAATNPLYNYYQCQDGKWIMFGLLATGFVWTDFCKAIGEEKLAIDPRFDTDPKRAVNCRDLMVILDNVFATKPRQEWENIFNNYPRIIFTQVNDGLDVANDPQAIANGYVVEYERPQHELIKAVGCPIKFRKTPAGIQAPAPEFGQHTEEVLINTGGYTREEIAQLKEEKVIG